MIFISKILINEINGLQICATKPFEFHNDFRAWSGAVSGALAPYLAYLFAKHWFGLKPRLQGLTMQRLLFIAILCGVMSPIFHYALIWVQTGLVDWTSLVAMITGVVAGIFLVLAMVKGLFAFSNRYRPLAWVIRRWTA